MDIDVKLKGNGLYWQAWWYDSNRRIKVKSLGAKSKLTARQARAKCRQLSIELMTIPERTSAVPTLTEWMAKYAAGRTHLAIGTARNDRDTAHYLERFFDWDPPIDQITRALAADWRDALASGELSLDNQERCSKPTETTVRNHVRRARAMFAEAMARDLIVYNPFDRLKCTPPRVIKNWAYLGKWQTARILHHCPSPGWVALFALCRLAGLRRGEAMALRWADIDFSKNRIHVCAGIELETTKQAKRVTPIELLKCPTGLTRILHRVFAAAREGSVLVTDGVAVRNVHREGVRILKRAGIPAYAKPFHTLRKNLKTDWTQHYPEYAVCEWLGHNADVGREHYLAVLPELWAPPGVAQTVPNTPSKPRNSLSRATSDRPAERSFFPPQSGEISGNSDLVG